MSTRFLVSQRVRAAVDRRVPHYAGTGCLRRTPCLPALASEDLLADELLEVLHDLVLDLDVPGALSDVHDEEQL